MATTEAKLGGDVKAAFGLAAVLAVGATLIDSGILGWIVAPIVLCLLFYAMAKAPLRSSLLMLMFCALTLENPAEIPAQGNWMSPLYHLGGLLLMHLKKTVGGPWFFSGMDIMLVALAIVHWSRKSSGSRIDKGPFATPKPLIQLAYLSLLGVLFVWLVGIVRGGADTSSALWQIDRVMYVPLVFLLFQAGLRGPQDHKAVAKVVLAAGICRALQARYVREIVVLPPNPQTGEPGLAYATTHHDSMLFAWATALIVALLVHRVRGNTKKLVLIALPILISGMLANNRRMVWVQIVLVFVTLYFMTAMNPIKRKIQRALLGLSPLAVLYIAIGWGSTAKIFKPVQTIRSAVDSNADTSTQWRDIENFNLLFTLRQYPIFGTGYGHGFFEVIQLPAVDYELERFIPHNSILGLWTYCGYVGFCALTALWVAGVYFAIRAYHAATLPSDKAAALVSFGGILIYYLQCYGDMGLGSWTGVFMIAPSLAVAGKLATATGAWPAAAAVRRAAFAPSRAAAPAPASRDA